MAHTNIDLDDNLVAEAMRLTEAKSKKEVVHLGLRELIRMARLRKGENIEANFTGKVI
jgi:Arc/MetJ family transcription regulator